MNLQITPLFSFFLAALAVRAGAAVPLRFAADAESPRTYQASAYRGETLDIEARLLWRGAPLAVADGAEAAMCWQTNGMGDAWWTAPASVTTGGVVTATWSPSNDVGAASYRVFFRVAGPGGASYRANMLLRLLGSPGATPNSLQLPVPLLDFTKITVTNAPWGESSGLTTNDVEAIALTRAEAEAGFTEWECEPAEYAGRPIVVDRFVEDGIGYWGVFYAAETNRCFGNSIEYPLVGEDYATRISWIEILATRTRLRPTPEQEAAWDAKADAASLGTAAYRNANEFATAADEALVYQLLMGSNVVAEVTNYNSRVRAPQLRLLQLDQDTHEYITVWAETNGLTRTFNEAKAYTDATSNALDMVKADRAWSKHTSGLGADAPDGVTWISTPQTVISGGYEYAKYVTSQGEVWVLTSNGLGLGADTNSYFAVKSGDGETLFSIEKTDSVLVGVDADGISVDPAEGVVSIPLNVVSAEAPVCYAANTLVNATWSAIDPADSSTWPAWVTGAFCGQTTNGWLWQIRTAAPSAFFQFRVLQPGATVIRNNAQTDLSAGILINGTRFYPHISGGTLTWTTTP